MNFISHVSSSGSTQWLLAQLAGMEGTGQVKRAQTSCNSAPRLSKCCNADLNALMTPGETPSPRVSFMTATRRPFRGWETKVSNPGSPAAKSSTFSVLLVESRGSNPASHRRERPLRKSSTAFTASSKFLQDPCLPSLQRVCAMGSPTRRGDCPTISNIVHAMREGKR